MALYENDNVAGTETSTAVDVTAANVTASDLSLSGASPASWVDSLNMFANGLTADLAGAIAADDYYEFTVTPDAGYEASYDRLYALMAVNVVDNEITAVLMSDAAGFTAGNEHDSQVATGPAAGSGAQDNALNFSFGAALQNVTSAVTFRLYLYQGGTAGANRVGLGHIFFNDGADDLRLEGSVALVPEPASLALLGLGSLAMLRRKG